MFAHAPDRRPLLPLDKRDTAFAVRQALGMRHHGPVQGMVDATMHGEVADLIADALADAGYVVAIPQRRRTVSNEGWALPKPAKGQSSFGNPGFWKS